MTIRPGVVILVINTISIVHNMFTATAFKSVSIVNKSIPISTLKSIPVFVISIHIAMEYISTRIPGERSRIWWVRQSLKTGLRSRLYIQIVGRETQVTVPTPSVIVNVGTSRAALLGFYHGNKLEQSARALWSPRNGALVPDWTIWWQWSVRTGAPYRPPHSHDGGLRSGTAGHAQPGWRWKTRCSWGGWWVWWQVGELPGGWFLGGNVMVFRAAYLPT